MGSYTLYEKSGYGATLIEPLKNRSFIKVSLSDRMYRIPFSYKRLICKANNNLGVYIKRPTLLTKSMIMRDLEFYGTKKKIKNLQIRGINRRYEL